MIEKVVLRSSEKAEQGMWGDVSSTFEADAIKLALEKLKFALPRLNDLGRTVELKLGSEEILIDATGDAARIIDGTATPEISLIISPSHLTAIIDNELQIRMATQFGYIRTENDLAEVIRFGDALAGRIGGDVVAPFATLPRVTEDLVQAEADLREFGYTIISNALSPEEVAALKTRLVEQCEAEDQMGVAVRDGGADLPNQRCFGLINKGAVFRDLMLNPLVKRFAEQFVGENFLLGSLSANIAAPGGEPSPLHYDQIMFQPPLPFMGVLNLAWFLDDVTEQNGGTRMIPGSQLWTNGPADPSSMEGTVAAEGPAGSVLIWDGRLWHATGANQTNHKRHLILSVFYRYYLRQTENYALLTAPDVEESLPDQLKTMLGFRVTGRLGFVEDIREGVRVTKATNPVRALKLMEGKVVPAE